MKVTNNNNQAVSKELGAGKNVTDNINKNNDAAKTGKGLLSSTPGLLTDSYNKINKALNDIPDVNMDKVHAVKKLIQEGKYSINVEAIADGMIKESAAEDI